MHRTTDGLNCPWCGETNDAATAADGSDSKPEAGCLTVCISCYGVCEFFIMKDGRLNLKPVDQRTLEPGDRAQIEMARRRLIDAKRAR